MQRFDIFVLPSQAEGISNTLLEAMASGLPVIATAVGGNPELVVQGQTGFLVAPQHPAEMADCLFSYAADKEKRLAHGQNGRRRVLAEFSMEAMTANYKAVYDERLGL
jgi:glycosyltransferase involved in cell wall biosynthesis